MRVVPAMTVDAGRRSLPVRHSGGVATAASERHVCAGERKVSQLVSEARLVELVDIGVASQMLRMTSAALTRGGFGYTSMVAGLRGNVGCDLLMADQAQGG